MAGCHGNLPGNRRRQEGQCWGPRGCPCLGY